MSTTTEHSAPASARADSRLSGPRPTLILGPERPTGRGAAFEGNPNGEGGPMGRLLTDRRGADGRPVGPSLGDAPVRIAGAEGWEAGVPAPGGTATDLLTHPEDKPEDKDLDGFRPGRPPTGLAIPRFAPDAVVTVRLPAATAITQGAPGEGKRKPPKGFRVPGIRAVAPAQTEQTSLNVISTKNRVAVAHARARTITDGSADPSAEVADALLSAGALRETDWAGGLDRTVRLGLTRWANAEMGMGALRMLGRLELVYTDDALGYSAGARLPRWREHFLGRRDRPVGFFGLRWQGGPRPVHVRRRVQALEAVWPGYGYSLMHLLHNAFVSAVNGHSFLWGGEFLMMGEAARAAQMRRFEAHDRDMFTESGYDDLTLERFGDCLPGQAWQTDFRLDVARRVAAEADGKAPALAPVAERALSLWEACRASGLTFYTLNHHRFLSWEMTSNDFRTGKSVRHPVEHLYRAPAVVTVWDVDNDPMTRLSDDHSEFCRSTMTYSDLTWIHGFQIGHAGVDPPAAREQFLQHQKAVARQIRKAPQTVNVWDAGYQHRPLPDGSLSHAVTALRLVLTIVRELDALLWLLHEPETLAEQSRAGRL